MRPNVERKSTVGNPRLSERHHIRCTQPNAILNNTALNETQVSAARGGGIAGRRSRRIEERRPTTHVQHDENAVIFPAPPRRRQSATLTDVTGCSAIHLRFENLRGRMNQHKQNTLNQLPHVTVYRVSTDIGFLHEDLLARLRPF